MMSISNLFKDPRKLRNDIIRYIIESHFGQMFKGGTLDPSQIEVEPMKKAVISCLDLDEEFLNELGDQFNFPLKIVRGHIDKLHMTAEWTNFFQEGFRITAKFEGLHLTLEPKEDIDDAASMWSSAIGRLVEKPKYKNNTENPVLLTEGAKKIDEFMKFLRRRLTLEFTNTVLCLQPRNSELGIRLAINVETIRLYDENEVPEKIGAQESTPDSDFTTKNIDFQGVSFWITDVPNEFGNDRNDYKRISKENKSDIMFAALNGTQVIKFSTRQSDFQNGPGVVVEAMLNEVIIFLTPRQIYLLSEFMEEYCKGDEYRFGSKKKRVQRPMTDSDYQKLEVLLQQQTCHPNTQYAGLQMGYGWSGVPIDETEEQYYSMTGNQSDFGMSMMDSMEGSHLNTSFHGTEYSERASTIDNRSYVPNTTNYGTAMSCVSGGTQQPPHEPGTDLFAIDLKISSFTMVLLHKDILDLVEKEGTIYTQDSISKLQELSTNFLTSIIQQLKLISEAANKEIVINMNYDEACNINNIRLTSTSVHSMFEMDPQKQKCDISFRTCNLNLLECLFENGKESEKVPILTAVNPSEENLYIKLVRQKNNSHTNLEITIKECEIELDITIIDRLSALINLPLFSQSNNSYKMQPRHTTHFAINIPSANCKLRFPIPDFTPLYDPSRVPWWKRNVRSDYMTLKCSQLKFETKFSTHKKSQTDEYSIKFRVMNLYYNESVKAKPIFFAQIGDDDQTFDDCRLIMKILPTTKIFNIEVEDDAATQSAFCENLIAPRDNGPFTSKRVFHHSNVEHLDDDYPDVDLLIPGDSKEIEEFKFSSKRSAKVLLTAVLSCVKIQIISKHTYEMIYNRINNDLLTWVPCAPKNKFTPKKDIFGEFSSAADYVDSDDDCDDFYDDLMFQSMPQGLKPEDTESTSFIKKYVDQSKLVIDVKIVSGTLVFNPPVRDASSNNVIPGQLGYFSIDVSEAHIFMVTGYKGDSELDYLCIDVWSADMRHHEMMPSSEVKNCLPDLRRIPSNLYPVISKSIGALAEERKGLSERQMLTVACKILTRHDTHHVKTVKIALGLNKSTLHHRMTAEPNSWVSQLIDFFKVTDFPINGYKSKDVMSEFHLHTWDCAIDYRPLYLPLRCALTLGSFSMTSSLSEVSKGSKLRFLAEDCDLYISKENPPIDGIASNIPINIRREYINIITMNIFELGLIMNEKNHKTKPRSSLRITTDKLHIHACSDSMKALTELISYIASDGDSTSNASSESSSPYPSPRHGPGDQELIPVDQQTLEICEVSEKQRQEINSLIGDAIYEEKEEKKPQKQPKYHGNSGFYSQIKEELGDIDSSDDDFEDSFCIIDKDNNWGLNIDHAIPDLEWLTTEQVKVTEDHFTIPASKKDLLKTPENFPLPIKTYTLCELNIIWQIYGGNDFYIPEEKKKEKRERHSSSEDNCSTIASTEYTESLCSKFTSVTAMTYRDTTSEKDWKFSGGINRHKDVLMEVVINKVRCQFDLYPEKGYYAHRFVFQIKEFEINDKMKCSEFNKFLCQYTSESTPKQSQGYMFAVEAVDIRPSEMMGETECSLRVSLLPLRFYIDQESLEFLMKFFSELSQKSNDEKTTAKASSKNSTPIHQKPKLAVKKSGKKKYKTQTDDEDENLIDLENSSSRETSETSERECSSDNTSNRPLFFRPVSFGPESFVKIDYKGKHVGAADGSVSGMAFSLIMGLAEINNSEIKLKRVCHRHGILGLDKVINYIIEEWLNDIKKHQLQNVLISVGPMQPVVQLLSGIRDLFWLPIEQYQKDGRIVRGLRKGTNRFTTSSLLATVAITSRFFNFLQASAETLYDFLSPGPSVRQITNAKKKKKNYSQPQDIREGVSNALWLFKEGFGDTAQTIVQVAVSEHEQKGVVGVVGGIARQIPSNIIKPIIIASEATNNVLEGIRSQLVPDAKTEANQKWRNNFD